MSGLHAGFVGLGNQGGPMAMRIAQAGIPLNVWARRPEALAPYIAAGARPAGTLAELGAHAQAVGICVFGDADVLQVAEAVLPGMAAGGVLLIHSTVHPDTIAKVARMASQRDVAVLDAPVSGGASAASEGRLTVMVGGNASALAKVRPIIDSYAGQVSHLGGLGAGTMAKLVNNAIMAANLASAHEAIPAGSALGLDRAVLLELIAASSGASFSLNLYAGRGGLEDFSHSVDLLTKDVDLLEAVSQSAGIDVSRLILHTRHFFNQVRAATNAVA